MIIARKDLKSGEAEKCRGSSPRLSAVEIKGLMPVLKTCLKTGFLYFTSNSQQNPKKIYINEKK